MNGGIGMKRLGDLENGGGEAEDEREKDELEEAQLAKLQYVLVSVTPAQVTDWSTAISSAKLTSELAIVCLKSVPAGALLLSKYDVLTSRSSGLSLTLRRPFV